MHIIFAPNHLCMQTAHRSFLCERSLHWSAGPITRPLAFLGEMIPLSRVAANSKSTTTKRDRGEGASPHLIFPCKKSLISSFLNGNQNMKTLEELV